MLYFSRRDPSPDHLGDSVQLTPGDIVPLTPSTLAQLTTLHPWELATLSALLKNATSGTLTEPEPEHQAPTEDLPDTPADLVAAGKMPIGPELNSTVGETISNRAPPPPEKTALSQLQNAWAEDSRTSQINPADLVAKGEIYPPHLGDPAQWPRQPLPAGAFTAALEAVRRCPMDTSISNRPVTLTVDWGSAGVKIARAVHHLDEALPNRQRARAELAFSQLQDAVAELRLFMRAVGYDV